MTAPRHYRRGQNEPCEGCGGPSRYGQAYGAIGRRSFRWWCEACAPQELKDQTRAALNAIADAERLPGAGLRPRDAMPNTVEELLGEDEPPVRGL